MILLKILFAAFFVSFVSEGYAHSVRCTESQVEFIVDSARYVSVDTAIIVRGLESVSGKEITLAFMY